MVSLKLEVHAVNELNRIAKAETENVLGQLRTYLNKAIKIQTGFSKKFKINYLKLEPVGYEGRYASNHNCYISGDYSSLWLHITICLGVSDGLCNYWKKEIWVGDCDDYGILIRVATEEDKSGQFPVVDFDTVEKQILDYQAAEKICDDIRSQLPINTEFLRYYVKKQFI